MGWNLHCRNKTPRSQQFLLKYCYLFGFSSEKTYPQNSVYNSMERKLCLAMLKIYFWTNSSAAVNDNSNPCVFKIEGIYVVSLKFSLIL